LWLRSQHGGIFFDFFEVERAYTVSHKLAFQPPYFIGEAYNVVDREVGKSILRISFGLFKIIEHSSIKMFIQQYTSCQSSEWVLPDDMEAS
jgi:hypothetical protein